MTTGDQPAVDRLREWWGSARYGPDAADPGDVATALVDELDRIRGRNDEPTGEVAVRSELVAGTLVELAATHPGAFVGVTDDLFELLDDDRMGGSVAESLGHVAAVDDAAFDRLLDPLPDAPDRRLRLATTALERTAERAPRRVAPASDVLVRTFVRAVEGADLGPFERVRSLVGRDDDRSAGPLPAVASTVARTLGAVAAADEDARERFRDRLDAGEPATRACSARTLGAAAGRGAEPCLWDVPDLTALAVGDAPPAVRTAAVEGLGAAAEEFPAAVADELGELLDCVDEFDPDATETVFERACRSDRELFETVLDRMLDRAAVEGDRLAANLVERTSAALVAGTRARPEQFANRREAVETLLEVDPATGARAIEQGARWRPDLYGPAGDRLLEWVDSYPDGADAPAAMRALAALAPTHPRIGDELADRLVDLAPDRVYAGDYRRRDPRAADWDEAEYTGEEFHAVARTCGVVANVAPEVLLSAGGDDRDWDLYLSTGDPAGERPDLDLPTLLSYLLDGPVLDAGVTTTLARLGRYDPDVVRPVTDVVAWRLPEALGRSRAGTPRYRIDPTQAMSRAWSTGLFELGGIAARVDPAAFDGVVDEVLDGLAAASRARTTDNAAGFLAGACVGDPDYVPTVVELLDSLDRPPVLRAIERAARDRPAAFHSHVGTLVDATRGRPGNGTVPAATHAVATVAKGLAEEGYVSGRVGRDIADRLERLVYDPDPEVRRWAAFGLGELVAGRGLDRDADPIDRVERVADRDGDDAGALARVVLVRAGRRPADEAVEALATVASGRPRPASAVGLLALRSTDAAGVEDALDRVRATATDPVVRRGAREALDDRR